MDPLASLFSAGTSLATGNPIGAALGIAGFGLSVFGGMGKANAAKEAAGVSQKMSQIEMQQDLVRQHAMELSAKRQQMEVLRNAQRARSLALNSATSQGAQFGSGLQGGYGQVSGGANWNMLGISQNLGFGEQMFGLNKQLNLQKMQLAQIQSQSAESGAIQSLGGSLISSMGPASNLTKGLFSGSRSSGGGQLGLNYGGSLSELY